MPDVKTFGALWVRLKQFRVPVIFWIALAFFGGIALWWRVYLDTNGGNDDRKLMVALGTSGLALAFGGVLGGIVKKLFDAWDDRKHALDARAAFLANLVDDFKTVYDMVERARFLITAHKSAKTYGESLRELPEAVIILHNVRRATKHGRPDLPRLYDDLEAPIHFCTVFLKNLIEEYRDKYLPVSRLQSQDEVENAILRKKIAAGEADRNAELSHSAWDDISTFPHLKQLLDATEETAAEPGSTAFHDYETAFVQYIDIASYCIRRRMPGSGDAVRNHDMEAKSDAAKQALATVESKRAQARDA